MTAARPRAGLAASAALATVLVLLAACAPATDLGDAPPPAAPATAATERPAAASPTAAERPVPSADLVIGLASTRDATAASEAMSTLARALESELGVTVALHAFGANPPLLAALAADEVQAAFLNPSGVVRSIDEAGATPVLALLRGGASASRGEFYARCNAPYASLADLRGARFAFVAPGSTIGHHAPHVTLLRSGIDPDSDLESRFAGAHDAVLRAIYDGDVDAGVTFEGGIEILAGRHADARTVVCSLGHTVEVPNDALVVGSSLDAEARDALATALLRVLERSDVSEALASLVGGDGLTTLASDDAYDVIREIAALF